MSIFDKVKAKAEELLGRAEEVYGQSHGDAAATAAGEAHRLEAEVAEEAADLLAVGKPRGRGLEREVDEVEAILRDAVDLLEDRAAREVHGSD